MKNILNSSLGIILLIFFFNRVLLPFGLVYSLLLTPFFFYFLVKNNYLVHTYIPISILLFYSVIHLFIGVEIKDFFVSSAMLVAIIIFITCFYFYYCKVSRIDDVIKALTWVNFGLTILAVISLFTGFFIPIFWYLEPFTSGYEAIPRLKLFELEASHYSFVLMPLFFYHFWNLLKVWNKKNLFFFLTVILSLILSFSLGILAVIFISLVLIGLVYGVRLLRFSPTRNKIFIVFGIGMVGLATLFFLFPENPLFFRIQNIFDGKDTSGRGRTYEAMEIGWLVAQQNNPFVGIGLGQFKIIGRETLINYYQFVNTPDVARLPNAMAETLVTFGISGFILKIIFQLVLFVKLKVYQNLFQLSLFMSLFIYQFTGSYLFNSMEYVLWILALYPKLKSFNLSNYFTK